MPHKRLSIEDREEILADMFEELRGLDADLLEAEGMSSRSQGQTHEALARKFPAMNHGAVLPAATTDEIRRALG